MSLAKLKSRYPTQGGKRPLIVTETTQMSGKIMCVAAIDLDDGKMVRPLSSTGANWTTDDMPNPFTPGAIVAAPWVRTAGAPPHGNEDARCTTKPIKLGECTPAELFAVNLASAEGSIERALGAAPVQGQYFVAGTQCRSLGGVNLSARAVSLHLSFNKWRTTFIDASRIQYDIAIKSLEPIAAIQQQLQLATAKSRSIVLRIGLARPWAGAPPASYNPLRCYLQVNGFVFPPDS